MIDSLTDQMKTTLNWWKRALSDGSTIFVKNFKGAQKIYNNQDSVFYDLNPSENALTSLFEEVADAESQIYKLVDFLVKFTLLSGVEGLRLHMSLTLVLIIIE